MRVPHGDTEPDATTLARQQPLDPQIGARKPLRDSHRAEQN